VKPSIVAKVARFPTGPGVYVFTGAGGRVLYVGKATNLRARVRQYLRPGGDGRPLLRFLERDAEDVEFVAVRTEQEALLLEDTIVKRRRPAYNIKLKDDKTFLMLRLDRREPWPWFRLVRRRRDDGADYFGPFASAKSVRRTLALLHKVVPLRDCKDGVFRNRSRPCIKHQIGRCPAPCVGLVDPDAYTALLDRAEDVLRGRAAGLLRGLRAEMEKAADQLEFERAQALKMQIEALEAVGEQQSVVVGDGDQDAIGVFRADAARVVVAVLMFRGGRLESAKRFDLRTELPDELLLGDLIARFYAGDRFIPVDVLVPSAPEDAEVLEDWLSDKRGTAVRVRVPQRGPGRRHLEMAVENARLAATQQIEASGGREDAAERLAQLLDLGEPPQRIHCIDVSTIQGRHTVASRVAFCDGHPDKAAYRRIRISLEHAGDDFSAMEEAVRRSLLRCTQDVDDLLPDLLIVDGGAGQLAAALRGAEAAGLGRADLSIVGLAKSRLRGEGDARQRTSERIFVEGRAAPHPLPDRSPEMLLCAAIRDEAHRFAITYHRKLRGSFTNVLDGVPGVGPARRRALLRHFGSLEDLRTASLDAIAGVPGVPPEVAARVHEALRRDPSQNGDSPS
jgi:excinuclease ABC subunit C